MTGERLEKQIMGKLHYGVSLPFSDSCIGLQDGNYHDHNLLINSGPKGCRAPRKCFRLQYQRGADALDRQDLRVATLSTLFPRRSSGLLQGSLLHPVHIWVLFYFYSANPSSLGEICPSLESLKKSCQRTPAHGEQTCGV